MLNNTQKLFNFAPIQHHMHKTCSLPFRLYLYDRKIVISTDALHHLPSYCCPSTARSHTTPSAIKQYTLHLHTRVRALVHLYRFQLNSTTRWHHIRPSTASAKGTQMVTSFSRFLYVPHRLIPMANNNDFLPNNCARDMLICGSKSNKSTGWMVEPRNEDREREGSRLNCAKFNWCFV